MRRALPLFFLLAFLYALTFGGHLYSPDEEILFRTTQALAERGSLAIEPLYGFATRRGADGREYAQYGVGQPLIAVPFYLLGKAIRPVASDPAWAALARRMRFGVPGAEGAAPSDSALAGAVSARLGVSAFNLVVTALSGVVLFLLARRLCGQTRAAWLAALLWGAGSMAWPHARTFFTEPLAGLCLLLCLQVLARYFHPRGPGSAAGLGCGGLPLLAGIVAGYGCLVRLDSIVFLPGLAVLLGWGDFRTGSPPAGAPGFLDLPTAPRAMSWIAEALRHLMRWRTIRRLFLFAIPVAAAAGVMLGLNAAHFGSPFSSAYTDQPEGITFSTPVLAGLYGFTMSVGKGMFFFSPALALCFWGFRPMLRRRRGFGLSILVIFVLFLLFQSSWRNWTGGWCWGPRHIMQVHALLAIPIAFWLAERWSAVRRVGIICALAVGGAVQVYGCSQNFIEFYQIYYRHAPGPVVSLSVKPYATVLYDLSTSPDVVQRYAAFLRDEQGRPAREIPLSLLPAPINDSIYVVQNSQWTRYAEMLRVLHIHDFFWLHLFRRP